MTKTYYEIFDFDSHWMTTDDYMNAVAIAYQRYKDTVIGKGPDADHSLAEMVNVVEVLTMADGTVVRRPYDWERALRELMYY